MNRPDRLIRSQAVDDEEEEQRPRQRQRRAEPESEDDAEEEEQYDDDDDGNEKAESADGQLIKKLVRYALACDFNRTAIRRDGIKEKGAASEVMW